MLILKTKTPQSHAAQWLRGCCRRWREEAGPSPQLGQRTRQHAVRRGLDRKSRAQHHLPRGANEKSRTLFKGHLAMSGDQSFARPGAEGQGLMPGHTSTWASRRTVQRSWGAGEKRTPEAQGREPRLRRGWATILKTTEKKGNKVKQGATRLGEPQGRR